MLRAFRSEWLKLRRPGMALAAGVIVVLGTLSTAITIIAVQDTPARLAGPGGGRPTLHELAAADGLARTIERAATLLGVVALGIFAVAVATEYSQGTLRNLLVRQPRRLRLLAGKLLAVSVLVTIAVLVSVGTAAGVAFPVAAGRGLDTGAWTTATGLQALASGAGDLALATLGWGLLGAALGIVLRSPAPAVGWASPTRSPWKRSSPRRGAREPAGCPGSCWGRLPPAEPPTSPMREPRRCWPSISPSPWPRRPRCSPAVTSPREVACQSPSRLTLAYAWPTQPPDPQPAVEGSYAGWLGALAGT
jgi:ABC-2 type transport system permease protein